MAFWNRCKHKLPKFPPDVIPIFKQMCGNLRSDQEVEELEKAVDIRLAEILKEYEKNTNIDVSIAQKLADSCHFLLSKHGDYTPEKQALLVGAVRYFAVSDDPFDDALFASGFYDDMKVINHVLEKLGIEDHYLDAR